MGNQKLLLNEELGSVSVWTNHPLLPVTQLKLSKEDPTFFLFKCQASYCQINHVSLGSESMMVAGSRARKKDIPGEGAIVNKSESQTSGSFILE